MSVTIIDFQKDLKDAKKTIADLANRKQELSEIEDNKVNVNRELVQADQNYSELKRLLQLYKRDPTNPQFVEFANISKEDINAAKKRLIDASELYDDIKDEFNRITEIIGEHKSYLRNFSNNYKNFIKTLPDDNAFKGKLKLEFMKIANRYGNPYDIDLDYDQAIQQHEEGIKHMDVYESLREGRRPLHEQGIRAAIASSLYNPHSTMNVNNYVKQDELNETKSKIRKSILTRKNLSRNKLKKYGVTHSAGGGKNKSYKNKKNQNK